MSERAKQRHAYTGNNTECNKKNRDVVKAIVFGKEKPVKKATKTAESGDPFLDMYKEHQVIEPPFDPMVLTMMEENSSELRQCVDAMEINIEGFGGRLQLNPMGPEDMKKNEKAIKEEKAKLNAFLLNLDPDDDLTSIRRKVRRDIELTGNGYWELIPPQNDPSKIAAISHVEAHSMRITGQDDTATKMTKTVVDPETNQVITQTFYKRFRRYVQCRNNKKIYFKEYGDPRFVSRVDGKAYADKETAIKDGVKENEFAHTILPFKIHSGRTPYGLPRYIGNLFSIFGSRASDEINYNTFLNNNVPNLAILVSGNAMLTEGTIKRINEFTQSIMKRSANYSKCLLLEAEPATDGIQGSGNAKIQIEKLKNEQQTDQLFQEYDKNNSDKIDRCFRLPPIFVGKASDYNRGTAITSRKLAEEQIFSPEREQMDRKISQLFYDMGFKYWRYKSYSPNITNDEDLIKMLNQIEKTGGMTPNFARRIMSDILNMDPELYPTDGDFNADIPFSLTMAEAVKGEASLGGNESTGTLAPNQGQIPNAEKSAKELDITDELIEGLYNKLDVKLNSDVNWEDENETEIDQ
jgi:PBSX family phage portal protein